MKYLLTIIATLVLAFFAYNQNQDEEDFESEGIKNQLNPPPTAINSEVKMEKPKGNYSINV